MAAGPTIVKPRVRWITFGRFFVWAGMTVAPTRSHTKIRTRLVPAWSRFMTKADHFDTVETQNGNNCPPRDRMRLAKRQAQDEARRKREIYAKKRTAIRLRMMIASIEQEIANLDASISSELALARVRKPSHIAYPIAARTMHVRRENLKATIAVLSDRYALTCSSEAFAVAG